MAGRADPGDPRGEPPDLRRPPCPPGTSPPRRARRSQAGGAADAAPADLWSGAEAASADYDPGARCARRRRPGRARLHSHGAEPALGRRHQVRPYLAGLALPRRSDGLLLAAGSSAGRCDPTSRPSSSSTHWRWRSHAAAHRPGSSITPTRGRNMCRCVSASAAARSASTARWARKATASITPSPRASSPRSRRTCSVAARSRPDKRRTAVFDYIEAFYNPVRLHSTLDYLSPVEYEKMNREKEKAA